MNAQEILARLVAVDTPDEAIVDRVGGYCQAAGAEIAIILGPEADWSNRVAKIGQREVGGGTRSGRTDVPPAGEPEWSGAFSCQRMIAHLGARLSA